MKKNGKDPELARHDNHTRSNIPLKEVFLPEDLESFDYYLDSGFPGEYPFTRGAYSDMYRGRLWTMEEHVPSGSSREANAYCRDLIKRGRKHLWLSFDHPARMRGDPDDKSGRGKTPPPGMAIDSLADIETLFEGIPVESIHCNMESDASACFFLAMYVALFRKRGLESSSIRGSIQNDPLQAYFTGGTTLFPLEASIRLAVDLLAYTLSELPGFNPMRISGHHIRAAGGTSVHEIAFAFCDALEYISAAMARGLDIDRLAPRLSFLFSVTPDFLEEIAKFRAARKLWAKIIKERLQASRATSCRLKAHARIPETAVDPTHPEASIARASLQSLAAILGGTQSLHVDLIGLQESFPSKESIRLGTELQEMIASETGVIGTVDPLGGSYCLEWLTREIVMKTAALIHQVDATGGMPKAIKNGFVGRELSRSRGLTDRGDGKGPPRSLKSKGRVHSEKERDMVASSLASLRQAAEGSDNLMPFLIEASLAYATIDEMVDALKGVDTFHADQEK